MNLHKDKDALGELIEATAESIGVPQVYVEKDYWVTKALKYLAESAHAGEVVFKGGTSLSKAYKLINRFSEDIDLAVFAGGRGDATRKKLLKAVESTVTQGLTYLQGNERESKGSSYRKTVYQYPRIIEGADFGQASPELVIEVNAFTNPEPFESRKLQSLIAEMLENQGRQDLIEEFELGGFPVNALSVRRTLVEKILGVIKDSYYEDPVSRLSDRIRHLYDICLILEHDEHRSFVASSEFKSLCDICINDERKGFFGYSECFEIPLIDAPLFSMFKDWSPGLHTTYTGIFSDLVYGELPAMNEVEAALLFVKENL